MSIEYVCDVAPPIRQRSPRKKLCYRCGERFDGTSIDSGGYPSEFERHEAECLRRAVESDQRKRAAK